MSKILAICLVLPLCGSPAFAQGPFVLSKKDNCSGKVEKSGLTLISCTTMALIIDPQRNQRLSCHIAMWVKYRTKSGGGSPWERLVVDSKTRSDSSGYCFIQPGLDSAHNFIAPLETPEKTLSPGSKTPTIFYLVYDTGKVTACINAGANDNHVSETACTELRNAGNF
jgi:hypothetical protein